MRANKTDGTNKERSELKQARQKDHRRKNSEEKYITLQKRSEQQKNTQKKTVENIGDAHEIV